MQKFHRSRPIFFKLYVAAMEMEIFFIKHSVCYVFHIKKESMYLHDIICLHYILYLQPPSARKIPELNMSTLLTYFT